MTSAAQYITDMLTYYNEVQNINRLIEHIKAKGYVINNLFVKRDGNYKNSGFLFELLTYIKANVATYCSNHEYTLFFWKMFLTAIDKVINEVPIDEGEKQAKFVLEDKTELSIQSLLTEFESCYKITGGSKKVKRKATRRKIYRRKASRRKATKRKASGRKASGRKH